MVEFCRAKPKVFALQVSRYCLLDSLSGQMKNRNKSPPSRHKTLNQCWSTVYDVVPTMIQRLVSAGQACDILDQTDKSYVSCSWSRLRSRLNSKILCACRSLTFNKYSRMHQTAQCSSLSDLEAAECATD